MLCAYGMGQDVTTMAAIPCNDRKIAVNSSRWTRAAVILELIIGAHGVMWLLELRLHSEAHSESLSF